ncbi:hypothetical protein ACHAWF_012750 [Thalassiosira exigua]
MTASPPTHATLRSGDGTVTIAPRSESSQSATIILCHGLGDTAEGFVDVAERLAERFPHAKFVLPTAPTRPVTLNMGMPMPAWYDIKGLDRRSNEECDGIEASRERLTKLIRAELDAGIRRDRIVLAGFSMGAALSLYAGMHLSTDEGHPPLAGIAMMSGYLAHESGFKLSKGLEGTPIWHGHGTADMMIPLAVAQETERTAKRLGATNYTLKAYQGLAHSCNPQELLDVAGFLAKVIPHDESCRVQLKDPGEMSVKELKGAIAKAGLGRQAVGLMEKREFVDLLRRHREGKL